MLQDSAPRAALSSGDAKLLEHIIVFPDRTAMLLRLLLLLPWAACEVKIPTVEIAKGVQMPVMSIGQLAFDVTCALF